MEKKRHLDRGTARQSQREAGKQCELEQGPGRNRTGAQAALQSVPAWLSHSLSFPICQGAWTSSHPTPCSGQRRKLRLSEGKGEADSGD